MIRSTKSCECRTVSCKTTTNRCRRDEGLEILILKKILIFKMLKKISPIPRLFHPCIFFILRLFPFILPVNRPLDLILAQSSHLFPQQSIL